MIENTEIPIIYTYPNVTSFKQRGGLKQRLNKLNEINNKNNNLDFQIVEIPADFIKNKTEETKTGLNVCSMLDINSVNRIYSNESLDYPVNYILHTEPIFRRTGCNEAKTPKLEWYSDKWINKFFNHVSSIIDFFGIMPYAIEIHPGKSEKGKNNIRTFSKAIQTLHTKYSSKYGKDTLFFIENRTGQHIQNGNDINRFWSYLSVNYPDLIEKTGIILDIQQLYTVTKENFKSELKKIPHESLYGLHIHERHRPPEYKYISEDIWNNISKEICNIKSNHKQFHVLPEVHHAKQVEETYKFCKEVLNL